jgi:hypothetical protein
MVPTCRSVRPLSTLATHPGMTGIVLDLPHVAGHAAKALAARGVGGQHDA